jgi:hypothetical protein
MLILLQLVLVLEGLPKLVFLRLSLCLFYAAHSFLNKDAKFVVTDLATKMLDLASVKLTGTYQTC